MAEFFESIRKLARVVGEYWPNREAVRTQEETGYGPLLCRYDKKGLTALERRLGQSPAASEIMVLVVAEGPYTHYELGLRDPNRGPVHSVTVAPGEYLVAMLPVGRGR